MDIRIPICGAIVFILFCVGWFLFFTFRVKFYSASVIGEIVKSKRHKKVGMDDSPVDSQAEVYDAYKFFIQYTVKGKIYNAHTKTYIDGRKNPSRHGITIVNYKPSSPEKYCLSYEDKERRDKIIVPFITAALFLISTIVYMLKLTL